MSKTGRNERCPCGSGKKYKKCCNGQPPYISDLMSNKLFEAFERNLAHIKRAHEIARQRSELKLLDLLKDCPEEPESQASRLREYAEWLETECAVILCKHSPVFWLSLDRRIPPWIWAKDSLAEDPSAHEQDSWIREQYAVKTALCLKHGNKSLNELDVWIDGSIQFKFSEADVVGLFGTLFTFFVEIADLQGRYRRVSKGISLQVMDGNITEINDREMVACMELYDQRRKEFSSTFSPIGFFSAFEVEESLPSNELKEDRWSTLMFSFNLDKNYTFTIPDSGRLHPNFRPYKFMLEALRFVEPFEEKVEITVGLTLQQLRLCFVALKNYLCDHWTHSKSQYTYLSRAALFAAPDLLHEKLTDILDQLFQSEKVERKAEEVISVFLALLSAERNLAAYDVLLRRGVGCLYRAQDTAMLDVSLHPGTLSDLLMDLQLDNEMRQIKGSHFESYVAERLKTDVKEISYPIRPGLKLKRKGEQNPFAEVDVYVELHGILFLIDCKAYSLTREYFRGDRKAVQNRWTLVNEWLHVSDRRARDISIIREGANYRIPNTVSHIVPIVCSAFPEFFGS